MCTCVMKQHRLAPWNSLRVPEGQQWTQCTRLLCLPACCSAASGSDCRQSHPATPLAARPKHFRACPAHQAALKPGWSSGSATRSITRKPTSTSSQSMGLQSRDGGGILWFFFITFDRELFCYNGPCYKWTKKEMAWWPKCCGSNRPAHQPVIAAQSTDTSCGHMFEAYL